MDHVLQSGLYLFFLFFFSSSFTSLQNKKFKKKIEFKKKKNEKKKNTNVQNDNSRVTRNMFQKGNTFKFHIKTFQRIDYKHHHHHHHPIDKYTELF